MKSKQRDNLRDKLEKVGAITLATGSLALLGTVLFINTKQADKIFQKETQKIEEKQEIQQRMNPREAVIYSCSETNKPIYVQLGDNLYDVKTVKGAKTDLRIMSEEARQFYSADSLIPLAYQLNNQNPVVRSDRERRTLGERSKYSVDELDSKLNGLEKETVSLYRR
jgi:hypothetical protein